MKRQQAVSFRCGAEAYEAVDNVDVEMDSSYCFFGDLQSSCIITPLAPVAWALSLDKLPHRQLDLGRRCPLHCHNYTYVLPHHRLLFTRLYGLLGCMRHC